MKKDIFVHIDQFDGPLALLLYLVQKDEMDIRDLNLTEITGQYLSYINRMKELNFDVAGEFLYMATVLIFLKSEKGILSDEKGRFSLGDDELNIETKEQLIAKLLNLEKYQRVSQGLWTLPKQGYETHTRMKLDKKQHFPVVFKEGSLQQITSLMIDCLKREKRRVQVIGKEKLSIRSKLESLKSLFIKGKKYLFNDLLGGSKEKTQEVVMTFISLLELARLRKIQVFQAEDLKEIYVDVVKSMDNFDVNEADGFDAEDNPTPQDSEDKIPPLETVEVHAPVQ